MALNANHKNKDMERWKKNVVKTNMNAIFVYTFFGGEWGRV